MFSVLLLLCSLSAVVLCRIASGYPQEAVACRWPLLCHSWLQKSQLRLSTTLSALSVPHHSFTRLLEGPSLSRSVTDACAMVCMLFSMWQKYFAVSPGFCLCLPELVSRQWCLVCQHFHAAASSLHKHLFWGLNIVSEDRACCVQVRDLQGADWGMSTDMDAVFKLILDRALAAKLPPDDMLDTLFIFSDMQFDEATTPSEYDGYNDSDLDTDVMEEKLQDDHSHTVSDTNVMEENMQDSNTNYHRVKNEFAKQGYKLPKVVFWDLRGPAMNEQASSPVTCTEDGTALVSGFSGQLLKLFMGGINDLESYNPFNVMKEAIAAEKYNGWRVVD